MPTMADIRRGGTPFDPFLYATVGEDRNGNPVTVLSTLARLGMEPWDAAADLARLPTADARSRLGELLLRFRDVPTVGLNLAAITQRLVELLPARAGQRARPETPDRPETPTMDAGPILAVLLLVAYLIYALFPGSDGAGQ
jgi:hypothetical protein